MRARFAFVAVLLFILHSVPAYSEQPVEIGLTETVSSDVRDIHIYPAETKEFKASISYNLKDKTRVEFTWTDPGGANAGHTVKTVFPSKTPVSITDIINISEYPEKNKPGIWNVQAIINGRKLSTSLLLTKNRQLLAISGNDKGRKLDALEHLENDNPDAARILEFAVSDSDGDVRLSAVKAARRLKPVIAREMLKKAQQDSLPDIRAEAFGVLYSRDYGYPVDAAEKAASDSVVEIRMLVAGSLLVKGKRESTLMKALLKDQLPGVVSAGLSTLEAQDGETVMDVLLDAAATGDKPLRRNALGILYSKGGPGRLKAIGAGLLDPDRDIRNKAFEVALTVKEAGTAMIRPLTNDPDVGIAIAAIGELYSRRDVEGLILGLRSGEKSVRLRSTVYLGKISGSEAIKGLEYALKDDDIEVRQAAVAGLRHAGEAGVNGLGEALADKDEGLRMEAISALAIIRTSKARKTVEKALADPSPAVRGTAVDYFASFEDTATASVLARVACDPDRNIRMRALSWLSKIFGEESSKAASAFITCGDAGMRLMAVEVLAGREDAAASGAVMAAAEDADPDVRLKAASSLLARGVKAPVARHWSDQSLEMRRLSLLAMAASPQPDMINGLKALSGDKDQIIRLMSIDVLKDINGPESGRLISALASDMDVQVSDMARQVLLDRYDEGAVDGLSIILAEGGQREKARAVEVLKKIPGPKADEALCEAFRRDGEIRIAVLRLLSDRQVSCLAEAVKVASIDPDVKLRHAAIECAGKVAPGVRDDTYAGMLSSNFAEVREAGVAGLAGNKKYSASLEKLLDDPVADIRRQALHALLEQKYPLTGRLRSLLSDSDLGIALTAFDVVLSLPDPREKVDLLVIAADGNHAELRVAAVRALVPLGDPRALPLFVKYITEGYEPDDMLRGIIEVKGPGSIDALSYVYHNGNEGQRAIAIKSLSGRGPETAKLALEAMDDSSQAVRREAVALSEGFDSKQRLDMAAKGLNDPVISIKVQAFSIIAGAEEELSVGYAVQSLNDPILTDKAFALLSVMKAELVVSTLAGAVPGLREPNVRAKALLILEGKGAGPGIFIKSLDDPEFDVKRMAVDALAKQHNPEAAYGLIIAGTNRDANIAHLASVALGKSKAEDLSGGIAMLFEKGMASREMLLFAASAITDPEALKNLVVRIKDETTLAAVLGTMLQSPSKAKAPAMFEGLKTEDVSLRARLVNVIASVGDSPGILPAIYRRYQEQRPAVIEAASRNGNLAGILELGLKDPDPAIRRQAASHLKEAAPGTREDIISAALSDADEGVRLEAVSAAASAGIEGALIKAASDPSTGVRRLSAAGLARLKSGKAPAVLEILAKSSSPEISGEALKHLLELDKIVPASTWRGLLQDRSVSTVVRVAAVDKLASLRDPQSTTIFIKALSGDAPEIEEAVVKGMPSIGKDALPAIYALLSDKKLRATALALIKQMGDTTAEGPLLSELPRMDDVEFSAALDILGAVGGGRSVSVLVGLYRDASVYRKSGILKALGHIKVGVENPAAVAVISGAIDSDNDSVRFYAVRSAGSLNIKGLKGKLMERVEKERSALIRNELKITINVIDGKD